MSEETTEVISPDLSEEGVEQSNQSMNDLVQSIMSGRSEGSEAQTEESEEEVPEITPETFDEDDSDPVSEDDSEAEDLADEDTDEEVQEDSDESDEDVLSQLNIDIESLTEEQISELASRLKSSSLKRFGKLTAQKREREERIQELESELDHLKTSEEAKPITVQDSPVANVIDPAELDAKAEEVESVIDWADDALGGETDYDDDGNEFLVEYDGKKYTREQIKEIKANAKKALGKNGYIETQRKFIQQRQESDNLALQTFEFFNDEKSQEYQTFAAIKSDPTFGRTFDSLPNGNYMLALLVEGEKAVRSRQNVEKATQRANKPKAKPRTVADSGATRSTPTRKESQSDLKKKIAVAQRHYRETGKMNDLIQLNKLKGQLQ